MPLSFFIEINNLLGEPTQHDLDATKVIADFHCKLIANLYNLKKRYAHNQTKFDDIKFA